MKVNLRQGTWILALGSALLVTPGANGYPPQDNRGQDQRHDDQQGDRRDGDRDHRRDDGPDGGYRQTCRDIHVSGNTLQASCEKKNGKWKNTSLRNFNRCTDQIENDNGKLVCHK
jgi:hypothetical protein